MDRMTDGYGLGITGERNRLRDGIVYPTLPTDHPLRNRPLVTRRTSCDVNEIDAYLEKIGKAE